MLKTYLLIAAVSVCGVVGQVLLKSGMSAFQNEQLGLNFSTMVAVFSNFNILGGVCLSASGACVWLFVLSRAQLSFALPLSSGLFYILLLLISQFILQEKVTMMRWMGVVVIIAGIFIVTRK